MLNEAMKKELAQKLNLQAIRAGYHRLADGSELTVDVLWIANISYFRLSHVATELRIGRIYKESQQEGFVGILEFSANETQVLSHFERFPIENQNDKVRVALKSVNLLNFDKDAYFGRKTFNFTLIIETWSSSITLSSLHTIEPSMQILWKALLETSHEFAEQSKNVDILAYVNSNP